MPIIGNAAPTLSLLSHEGKQTTLEDYQGKWVILYFYPKDDTPGCTVEACDFSSLHEQLSSCNAVVIGVSPDSVESHQAFIEKHKLKVTLLSDPEKNTLKAYKAWGVKKNYGKEYEGVIRSTFIISPDGMLAHVWHNVRAKGHADRVRSKLEELQTI